MNILLDPHIPFARGPLESTGASIATDFTPENIREADTIICRTRARLNAETLAGSRVRLIATATIGTDHIDLDYCRRAGITVANAPGCNAPAVGQWVTAAVEATGGCAGKTLGVIGVGNVGKVVARWGAGMGMKVLLNDPPRQEAGEPGFVQLDTIAAEADVITVHTPLTKTGDHPTFHLIDSAFVAKCRRRPMILNTARGPVTETGALIAGLRDGILSATGIDCWENEPDISRELLGMSVIATPHIAGYSKEGKIRATQMALDAFCSFYGLAPLRADAPAPAPVPDVITDPAYDIMADTRTLKTRPEEFERLRNTYDLRPEPRR